MNAITFKINNNDKTKLFIEGYIKGCINTFENFNKKVKVHFCFRDLNNINCDCIWVVIASKNTDIIEFISKQLRYYCYLVYKQDYDTALKELYIK